MGESDRDQNAAETVDAEQYVDRMVEYLQSRGYETATNELNSSAVMIACVAGDDFDGSDRTLCLVETATDTPVSLRHMKYLLKTGKGKDVGSLSLTSLGGVSPDAKQAANKYGVEIVQPSEIVENTAGFGVAVEDIELPDSSGTTDTDQTTTEESDTTAAEPAEASPNEMTQEKASLLEVLVMLLGSAVALIGLVPFVPRFSRIAGQSPGIAAILGLIICFPPLFVGISAIDDYFNLRVFGSWRVRKENVAGAMGIVILVFGIMLSEVASNFLYRESEISGFVSIGGAILLFYSASIYITQMFFEKRRGRR